MSIHRFWDSRVVGTVRTLCIFLQKLAWLHENSDGYTNVDETHGSAKCGLRYPGRRAKRRIFKLTGYGRGGPDTEAAGCRDMVHVLQTSLLCRAVCRGPVVRQQEYG